MNTTEQLIADLTADIEHHRLKLPVLSDVALKVHALVDNPNSSTQQIAKVISLDSAISARLLQIANSPMFRGSRIIEDISSAILRLGNSLVKSVVTVMMMEKMYRPHTPEIAKRVQQLWYHNTQVAALSYVLASNFTSLSPNEALLAGLFHDIGTLPILERAENHPEFIRQPELLDHLIQHYHCPIGKQILESWNFPKSLITVVQEHENLDHCSELLPELVDVVIVANLHSHVSMGRSNMSEMHWDKIPAFKSLGLTPEQSIQALKDAGAEIRGIMQLFNRG